MLLHKSDNLSDLDITDKVDPIERRVSQNDNRFHHDLSLKSKENQEQTSQLH